jgi:hypothetical protein
MVGQKFDADKLRFSLIPKGVLPQVIRVLEFGAKKYSEGNWQNVENARTRYFDAAHRHIEAWWKGEKVDAETGESHLAHAICCLMFLLAMDDSKKSILADPENIVDGFRNFFKTKPIAEKSGACEAQACNGPISLGISKKAWDCQQLRINNLIIDLCDVSATANRYLDLAQSKQNRIDNALEEIDKFTKKHAMDVFAFLHFPQLLLNVKNILRGDKP